MAVELAPETQKRIERELEAGNYPSADALVEEALDLLAQGRDSVREMLEQRLEDRRTGKIRLVSSNEVTQRLRRELETGHRD